VICLYVHVSGPVEELVRLLAAGVAQGGTLLLVGHRPVDPATGAATPAAGQVQVSVEEAVAALHPARWEILVAEERPRQAAGTGVDPVVRATARATRPTSVGPALRSVRFTARATPTVRAVPGHRPALGRPARAFACKPVANADRATSLDENLAEAVIAVARCSMMARWAMLAAISGCWTAG
jgi:hypothetical protein